MFRTTCFGNTIPRTPAARSPETGLRFCADCSLQHPAHLHARRRLTSSDGGSGGGADPAGLARPAPSAVCGTESLQSRRSPSAVAAAPAGKPPPTEAGVAFARLRRAGPGRCMACAADANSRAASSSEGNTVGVGAGRNGAGRTTLVRSTFGQRLWQLPGDASAAGDTGVPELT
jgi:hypothetical protein